MWKELERLRIGLWGLKQDAQMFNACIIDKAVDRTWGVEMIPGVMIFSLLLIAMWKQGTVAHCVLICSDQTFLSVCHFATQKWYYLVCLLTSVDPFIDLCWLLLFNHLSLRPSAWFRHARLIIWQVSACLDASPPLLCRAWWRLYWPDSLWSRQHGCEQLSCLIKEARRRWTKGLSLLILLKSVDVDAWRLLEMHNIVTLLHILYIKELEWNPTAIYWGENVRQNDEWTTRLLSANMVLFSGGENGTSNQKNTLMVMMMMMIKMIENKTGCLSFMHHDTREINIFSARINYMQVLMTQFCSNYCSNYSCRKWENV